LHENLEMLYTHQINAVEKVCSENFKSGVIKYATGTGKSRIGMELVKNEYIDNYLASIF